MNIALPLRYKYFNSKNWELRDVITHDILLMSEKLGVGLVSVFSKGFEEVCEECEGLILPCTSMDTDPKYYNGETEEYDKGELELDTALIRYFHENGKPIFAIGTAAQEVNSCFGGSYKRLEEASAHNGEAHRHVIKIEKDGFVYKAFGKPEAEVNSMHSWRFDKIAPDFKAVATAEDGVAEAIEWTEKNIFAVQWHPERCFIDETENPIEARLFESFLECCRRVNEAKK